MFHSSMLRKSFHYFILMLYLFFSILLFNYSLSNNFLSNSFEVSYAIPLRPSGSYLHPNFLPTGSLGLVERFLVELVMHLQPIYRGYGILKVET
jgi:hypothetical protein